MGKIYSLLLAAILIFWVPVWGSAQDTSDQQAQPAPATSSTGATAFAVAVGKHSNLGGIYTAGVGVGYNITEHFGGDIGASLYTVQSPFSPVSNHDWVWTTLAGDPFVDLRYTTKLHGLDATSILTGSIPISGAQRVFSTGRFGGDWYNHITTSFAGFSPFLNFGVANETIDRYVIPRPYNIARPYQIFGVNGNGEVGANFTVFKHYTVGASAYALVPVGRQKVFSRLVTPNSAVVGDANHFRVWNNAFETIGDSKLGRDNGYSGWVEVAKVKNLKVQAGYTYSVHYRWGSAYLMLKFDGTSLIRFLTATE
ncbi:MAG TPA: hypothetical protein VFL79_15585 [Terriglobia bacterium]|nr:hypothetical protein [Terriglobia bacterium]